MYQAFIFLADIEKNFPNERFLLKELPDPPDDGFFRYEIHLESPVVLEKIRNFLDEYIARLNSVIP